VSVIGESNGQLTKKKKHIYNSILGAGTFTSHCQTAFVLQRHAKDNEFSQAGIHQLSKYLANSLACQWLTGPYRGYSRGKWHKLASVCHPICFVAPTFSYVCAPRFEEAGGEVANSGVVTTNNKGKYQLIRGIIS